MHEPSDILQIGKGSKMSGPIQMLISTPFDVIKVFFQVFNERNSPGTPLSILGKFIFYSTKE